MQNITQTINSQSNPFTWHMVALFIGIAILAASIRAESRHLTAAATGHHEPIVREIEVRHAPPTFGGLRIPSTSSN